MLPLIFRTVYDLILVFLNRQFKVIGCVELRLLRTTSVGEYLLSPYEDTFAVDCVLASSGAAIWLFDVSIVPFS